MLKYDCQSKLARLIENDNRVESSTISCQSILELPSFFVIILPPSKDVGFSIPGLAVNDSSFCD